MSKTRLVGGLMALCAAAASALAFPGPDVIVGAIADSANSQTPPAARTESGGWQNYGAGTGTSPNRIFSYAIGTYSCNLASSGAADKGWIGAQGIGINDNALLWMDSTAGLTKYHPVISQNLYKLSNNRFTQIGQAWLKHGFCALQGTICSACTSGGNCDYLYPGCSDPYSSGLNGSQGGLGPKGEVNAATGDFLYPWVNNGIGANDWKFKRLQAKESELTDATAQFFVASMYMQAEDRGGSGGYGTANSFNSQSYKRATINQTTFDMALTGLTERGKPAIQAWQDADATVVLTNVDVPSDGRFIVGAKVITLGGGMYRYEYAIQNFHSDRSGGSFSVPVPAGSTVTNIGFHDVDYHSGDGHTYQTTPTVLVAQYNNTDWTSAYAGGAVTWSCTTPYNAAQDSGNALRWDTIYNFWFECNVAPATGTANLGLYKTGSPASMAVSTRVPGSALVNDNCVNAIAVGSGTTSFDTSTATTDGPAECVTASDQGVIGKDAWFRWTNGNCSGNATISTCGSTFDTKLAVYNNACPSAANTSFACNDDNTACGSGSLQSSVTFAAAANATYLIRVGGYDADGSGAGVPLSGVGSLNITPPAGCLANETCSSALVAAAGTTNFDTTLALTDGFSECASAGGYTNVGKDVWYRWTNGTTSGTATIDTCGSSFDTKLAVYTACPSGANQAISCNDNSAACGASSTQSQIQFPASANTTYYIRVGGATASAAGVGVLNITAPVPVPPGNDACANATWLSDGVPAVGDTTLANNEIAFTSSCGSATAGASKDVWFKYKPNTSATVEINTCGSQSDFDTILAIFASCPASASTANLYCVDDVQSGLTACSSYQFHTKLTYAMTAGTTYYIRLGGYSTAEQGAYQIVVTGGGGCAPPTNDPCSGRPGIAEGSFSFTTCGATTDGVPVTWNSASFQVHNDIWFNYPVHTSGTVTFSLCGTSFNSRLAVYNTGTCAGVAQGTLMACGDSECGNDGSVTHNVTQGNNCTVRIGGDTAADLGALTLSISLTPLPACPADLDNDGSYANGMNPDGGVDISDLLAFLGAFEAGHISADLDNDGVNPQQPDGGVDISDLLFFLGHFEAGC